MLYTLSKNCSFADIDNLLTQLTPQDAVLLLQNAVVATVATSSIYQHLLSIPATIYVLKDDLIARGLLHCCGDKVNKIDYAGFVELTMVHFPQFAVN